MRLSVAAVSLILAAGAHAEAPRRQPDKDGRQVWHSRHFRIELTDALAADELAALARTADATADAVKSFPLPLFAPPADGRPRILVCGSDAEYEAQGGARGSAGFFVGRGVPRVLIDARHLREALHESAAPPAPRMNEDLIVHEIVHLCMHRVNGRLPQWFQEGIAEYFASAHQGRGRFDVSRIDAAVRDHVQSRLAPGGGEVPLDAVGRIVGLGWREWLDYMEDLPAENRYRAYATSLLMAHYVLHGPERREQLREELARERPRRAAPVVLVEPSAAPELESMLRRYWADRGLKLAFPAAARD